MTRRDSIGIVVRIKRVIFNLFVRWDFENVINRFSYTSFILFSFKSANLSFL